MRLIRNQIMDIPEAFFQSEAAKSLEELSINSNPLKVISPCINYMTELETLGIAFTELVELPPTIRTLTKLKNLNVAGNKLREPHQIICERGISAI